MRRRSPTPVGRLLLVLGVLLASAVVAAACGGSGDDDAADPPSDPAADEPAAGGATWTGVTDESVTLGVLVVDFAGLKEAVGVDLDNSTALSPHRRSGKAGRPSGPHAAEYYGEDP